MVNIRTFFAIDLDVDEAGIHHRRDGFVFETFMRHHVAPVTGGITDREQDRSIELLRDIERFPAPREPVDGVVAVLEQIGA